MDLSQALQQLSQIVASVPDWAVVCLDLVVCIGVALIIHALVHRLLLRLTRSANGIIKRLLERTKGPMRLTFALIGLSTAIGIAPRANGIYPIIQHLLQLGVILLTIAAPVPLPRPAGLEPVAPTASVDDPTLLAAAQVPFDKLFPAAYDDVATAAKTPVPLAPLPASDADVPVPAHKSYGLMVATGEFNRNKPQNAVAAIASIEQPPMPATRSDTALGYAEAGAGSPAEGQLQAIIESETTGAVGMTPGNTALTNSVGSPLGADALKSYAADRRDGQALPPPPTARFATREPQLVAPGMDGTLITPVAMTSNGFATFSMPSARDISPATELGPMIMRVGFHPDRAAPLGVGHFAPPGSLLLASR